ncbi:MAG: site-specific integrase, partial [Dokdonella sp.]
MSVAKSAIAAGDQALIDGFLERAWSELGLADNTLASYRRDLSGFARWLAAGGGALNACSRERLFLYLAERSSGGGRNGRGYDPKSNARLLSSLRHFYRFQQRDGRIHEDPTLLVDAPKVPRSLPKALAESEIEGLLHAPADTPLGIRDRCMLVRMLSPLLLRDERRSGMRVKYLERLRLLIGYRRQREIRVFPLLRIALDLHVNAA